MHLFRRAMLLTALLALGCSAQTKPEPEIAKRIERQVRSSASLSAGAEITVGERKPSEFGGWDLVTVTARDQGQEKRYTFLLSKDGKSLVHFTRFDLSVDPNEAIMRKIDLSGRPPRGNKDAKVVAVVYDDFQCPYCARMYETLFSEVLPRYQDKVKVVYKDFPLYEIHPWAVRAAVNANCLAEQSGEAYWRFSDEVHRRLREINQAEAQQAAPQQAAAKDAKPPARGATLDKLALEVGAKAKVDAAKLQACIQAQDVEKVRLSLGEGRSLGVSATPTLFINGERLEGAVSSEELEAVLNRALLEVGETPPPPAAPSAAKPAAPSQ